MLWVHKREWYYLRQRYEWVSDHRYSNCDISDLKIQFKSSKHHISTLLQNHFERKLTNPNFISSCVITNHIIPSSLRAVYEPANPILWLFLRLRAFIRYWLSCRRQFKYDNRSKIHETRQLLDKWVLSTDRIRRVEYARITAIVFYICAKPGKETKHLAASVDKTYLLVGFRLWDVETRSFSVLRWGILKSWLTLQRQAKVIESYLCIRYMRDRFWVYILWFMFKWQMAFIHEGNDISCRFWWHR